MTTRQAATPRSFWTGRGELLVVALVAAIGVFLLVRTATMEVPGTAGFLGPQFFPAVVGAFLLALSAMLAVQVLRHPRGPAGDDESATESGVDRSEKDSAETVPDRIDWKPLGIVAGTLVLHLLLLEPLGWILAGALLFFGVSYALGGRNILRDIGISFVISAAAQLGFSAGLGLSLPAGILVGVL